MPEQLLSSTKKSEAGFEGDRNESEVRRGAVCDRISKIVVADTVVQEPDVLDDGGKEGIVMVEEEKANQFWEKQLAGEEIIDVPQKPGCELAIAVPVFGEEPRRILDQLQSVLDQTSDLDKFEIMYVVNNGERPKLPEPPFDPKDVAEYQTKLLNYPEELAKFQRTLELNQAVLNLPIWTNKDTTLNEGQYSEEEVALINEISEKLTVFVIDKSSAGHEIPKCNVGKARNRALAEASLRFHKNGKNGILVQTDADTVFSDPEYVSKVMHQFEDPDVIGIAGGLDMIIDPDSGDHSELESLRGKMDDVIRSRMYARLSDFYRNPKMSFNAAISFSGANMLSRSLESAAIGGFIDANKGEDPQFGRDLEELASTTGKRVIYQKDELKVSTAFRLSDRTGAGFAITEGKDLSKNKDKEVDNPDIPTKEEFRAEFMQKLLLANSASEILELFPDHGGEYRLEESDAQEMLDILSLIKEDDKQELATNEKLIEWRNNHFGQDFDVAGYLWDVKFKDAPLVKLDDDVLEKWIKKVKKIKGGEEMVKAIIEQIADFKRNNDIT